MWELPIRREWKGEHHVKRAAQALGTVDVREAWRISNDGVSNEWVF